MNGKQHCAYYVQFILSLKHLNVYPILFHYMGLSVKTIQVIALNFEEEDTASCRRVWFGLGSERRSSSARSVQLGTTRSLSTGWRQMRSSPNTPGKEKAYLKSCFFVGRNA